MVNFSAKERIIQTILEHLVVPEYSRVKKKKHKTPPVYLNSHKSQPERASSDESWNNINSKMNKNSAVLT